MHMVMRNALAARDPTILKDVDADRVERVVEGPGHSPHQSSQRLSLVLGEVENRRSMACRDHQYSSLPTLEGVNECGS